MEVVKVGLFAQLEIMSWCVASTPTAVWMDVFTGADAGDFTEKQG